MINYYESLGLEASATGEEIKAAFRTLAKRHHPDVVGGDPVRFARITEAYEVLSDEGRRRNFDRMLKARDQRRSAGPAFRPGPGGPGGPGGPDRFRPRPGGPEPFTPPPPPPEPGPPITRLMSLMMPPTGRFLLEGLTGEFIIKVNRPDKIWETTAAKFKGEPPAVLASRVVQIRLHGPRELVRRLRPIPTDFGVQLQGSPKEQFTDALFGDAASASAFLGGLSEAERMLDAPVKMTVTLPEGVPLYLYDLSGKITVGDLNSEIVATIDGTTMLRAGKAKAADLTLNGRAKAYISDLHGGADALVFGNGKLLLDGSLTRLRVVIEHEGHVEVAGKVDFLQASVNGRGYLNAKGAIDRCHYDVRAGGYLRLAKVSGAVTGARSGAGGVDVIEGPPPEGSGLFGRAKPGGGGPAGGAPRGGGGLRRGGLRRGLR